MPDEINTWFSDCFGFAVILAYMGDCVGVKKNNDDTNAWISTIKPIVPKALLKEVNFSDTAPLLITSEASLTALHPAVGRRRESSIGEI